MSDLGTYGLEENKLLIGNDHLKNHTSKLKENIIKAKQINNDPKFSNYLKIMEETLLPVLDKYSSKMEELLIETKQTEKETL